MSTIEQALPSSQSVYLRRGLWIVGAVLTSGIAIAGFSIVSSYIAG